MRLRTRIAVSELAFPGAARADLNGDGFVDIDDIRAFAMLHGLELLPEFNRKMEVLEGLKTRSGRRRR